MKKKRTHHLRSPPRATPGRPPTLAVTDLHHNHAAAAGSHRRWPRRRLLKAGTRLPSKSKSVCASFSAPRSDLHLRSWWPSADLPPAVSLICAALGCPHGPPPPHRGTRWPPLGLLVAHRSGRARRLHHRRICPFVRLRPQPQRPPPPPASPLPLDSMGGAGGDALPGVPRICVCQPRLASVRCALPALARAGVALGSSPGSASMC
ncbi:hypothetical protein ACQJBY_040059 [Aegilops geniculata]